MDTAFLERILNEVAGGEKSPAEAMEVLRDLPYRDMGFAKVDKHRALRCGAAEVVFGQGKTPEQAALILEELAATNANVLCTRASAEMYEAVKRRLPEAHYDRTARLILLRRDPAPRGGAGVAVVSAGAADMPVAEEAALTAEFYGSAVLRVYDVGVAGLHRLLDRVPRIRAASVVVVVAGMEGALASVVGGLVDKPVIAVPTSVGYGASLGGLAALFAMLNSCSLGVSVMNIDNGFGAGYLAALIDGLSAAPADKARRDTSPA
ncbi:MAG: nickel pincer cofactor biosynthesis protein LarB [Clostridiales Family XIII bacterium]|nr:nickel pincer cofactor biosynthesis protein LarB [Clostridiales Family XIII bacterium]